MFIAFIASNIILWVTLFLTVTLASMLPAVVLDMVNVQWLSVTISGSAVGLIVGRSYDLLIPSVSDMLPRPITPGVFAVAAFFIVALAICAALRQRVTIFDNPQSPLLLLGSFVITGLCAVELWPLMPSAKDWFFRGLMAMTAGIWLFGVVLLLPVYLFGAFVDYYNTGFASYVSGWTAGLASRLIKSVLRAGALEGKAGGAAVKSIVQRDMPVIISVVIVYVLMRSTGTNPILFSVFVGLISPVVLAVVAQLIPVN